MKKFLSRLNPRLLLIHFVATWLFVYSFRTLAFLYDIGLVKSYYEGGKAAINNAGIIRIYNFNMVIGLSYLPGILAAFTISLILSIRNKWYWVNSLLVFIVSFILLRFDDITYDYFMYIFIQPGKLVSIFELKFIINGAIILLLGSLLLFNKRIIRFIAAGEVSDKQKTETGNPLN